MTFTDLLREVIARLKLPAATPAADARNLEIALSSGQTISLSLLDDDATCAIAGFICFYPEAARQRRLFEVLLAAHAFGFGTAGATFGVDMDSSKIFLFRTFALDEIELEAFTRALRRFVEAHRTWLEAHANGRLWALVDDTSAAPQQRGG